MIDRKLIFLLLVLIFYVFYIRPETKAAEQLKEEVAFLQHQINKEEFIDKNKETVKERLKEELSLAKERERLFYPSGQNVSNTLSYQQELIKGMSSESGMEIVRSNWGEPLEAEGLNCIKIPLTFIVKGYPPQIDNFLKFLFKSEKLIKIERASIGRFEDEKNVLNFSMIAYQLKSN